MPGVERAATELGRRRAGGLATEVEGLEERCQRRLVGAWGTDQGGDEQAGREQSCPGGEPGGTTLFPSLGGPASWSELALHLLGTWQEGVAIHNRRGTVLDNPLLTEDALRIDEKKDLFASISR